MNKLALGKLTLFRIISICCVTENGGIIRRFSSFDLCLDNFLILSAIHQRLFTSITMMLWSPMRSDFFIGHIYQYGVMSDSLSIIIWQMKTLVQTARSGVKCLKTTLINCKMILVVMGVAVGIASGTETGESITFIVS